jgi:transposase
VETPEGGRVREVRVDHERGELKKFLEGCEPGSPVAVETIGNWYWIVDEIESAGMKPRLVHARKAKLMMGSINKTDKLDAKGLNLLQRAGTLPTVWIPPGELRDQRDLPRTRMVLTQMKTKLKNRVHSNLAKYGYKVDATDIFVGKGREQLEGFVGMLPTQTQFVTGQLLEELASVTTRIRVIEGKMEELLKPSQELDLVRSLPGIGFILGSVIVLEIGDITRFANAERLASYAGTTPRVSSSGGKTRYGALRPDVNRYLKWAFVEAANCVALNSSRWPDRHAARRYLQLRLSKGHQKAIGAVARHLAEAAFWILTKKEPYRDPASRPISSRGGISARSS